MSEEHTEYQAGVQEGAVGDEVNEITENIAAEPNTWAREHGKWHETRCFHVYVYRAWGGGWGAVVNIRTTCNKQMQVEGATMIHSVPEDNICEKCWAGGTQ